MIFCKKNKTRYNDYISDLFVNCNQIMYICRKCSEHTNFKDGLCIQCWIEAKKSDEYKHGLSNKDYQYHYNMIKWRIAETLIQELFLASDFDVFHYGMESTVPWIMDLLYGIKTEVAQNIRRMPDFVIHDSKTNSFYFTEIKYRWDWKFSIKNLDDDYPYHNAYFIIISKKDIKCLTYNELKSGQVITPESNNYLVDRKEFHLNKDIVSHFTGFATKFFECV